MNECAKLQPAAFFEAEDSVGLVTSRTPDHLPRRLIQQLADAITLRHRYEPADLPTSSNGEPGEPFIMSMIGGIGHRDRIS